MLAGSPLTPTGSVDDGGSPPPDDGWLHPSPSSSLGGHRQTAPIGHFESRLRPRAGSSALSTVVGYCSTLNRRLKRSAQGRCRFTRTSGCLVAGSADSRRCLRPGWFVATGSHGLALSEHQAGCCSATTAAWVPLGYDERCFLTRQRALPCEPRGRRRRPRRSELRDGSCGFRGIL